MTREELIDAIDRQIVIAPPFTLGGYTMFLHSLRAVVELHKPQPTTIPSDPKCSACSGLDWCDYPCQTIQAIEKELQYD